MEAIFMFGDCPRKRGLHRSTPFCDRSIFGFVLFMLLLASARDANAQSSSLEELTKQKVDSSFYHQSILPVIQKHCFDCHAQGSAEGKVQFDAITESELLSDKRFWLKVLRNVRADTMPPKGNPRPTEQEKILVAEWIEKQVFQIDPSDPYPGKSPLRRLNRNEYRNTIRDLMGVDFNAEVVFPPDDTGFGFDNVSEAMSVSPMLMEKYLQAAKAIVEEAVPLETWVIPSIRLAGREFHSEDRSSHGDRLNHDRPTRVEKTFEIQHAGEYRLQVLEKRHGSFDYHPGRYHIVAKLDGEALYAADYQWEENKEARHESSHRLEPGTHRISIELATLPDHEHEEADLAGRFVHYELAYVNLQGPMEGTQREHPRGYKRFFPRESPPEDPVDRRDYAREILEAFAMKAYRKPVSEEAVDRLIAIAETSYLQADATFEAGISKSIMAVLASPRFLFRLEESETLDEGSQYPLVDEYALASRLSYLLWSTMPDAQLFDLAASHQLRTNLDRQIQRMVRDPRAIEFIKSFSGQWLRARDVENVSIDPVSAMGYQKEFEGLRKQLAGKFRRPRKGEPPLDPEVEKGLARMRELGSLRDQFDASVRNAMRRETEMSFDYLVREDRSLLELLDANYVFVNEKLAKLYGIEGIRGNELQRVELPPNSPRGGILTQGTMLSVTSNPTRTSPVKRGLFILDNILGTPAPPAPPNVPALEDAAGRFGDREPSLKELLAAHREAPLCSSCHSRMDPLGLALENFNAFGAWRELDAGQPIESAGELITGESFRDVRELKKILVTQRKRDFYRCVAEKFFVYALGRGLEYYDEVAIDRVVDRLEKENGRFGVLLEETIHSAPFQRRIDAPDASP